MSTHAEDQSAGGSNPSFYNPPRFLNVDGLSIMPESIPQIEQHACCETGNSHDNGDDDDDDSSNFVSESLLHQYRNMMHTVERYICTSEQTFTQLCRKRQRLVQHDRSMRHRAELIHSAAVSPIVKLNISGVRFEVHRDTLMQFPSTVFHFLDCGQFAVQKDDCGYIFLDRDPWLFRELLFLLRERRQKMMIKGQNHSPLLHFSGVGQKRLAQLPPVERRGVIEEARYYGLNELISEVLRKRFQWRQCILVPFFSQAHYGCGTVLLRREERMQPPVGCCFASCVCLHDIVYLFGGCSEQNAVLSSFYKIRLECDTAGGGGKKGKQRQHEEGVSAGVEEEEEDDEEEEEEEGSISGRIPTPRMQCVSYDLVDPCEQEDKVPDPRSGHAMVSLLGRYVLIFYGNDLHRHLKDVWVYHTVHNVWTRVKTRGSHVRARSGHSVTVVGDRLFLIGGKRHFEPREHIFAEVFEGSFDADRLELTWSLVSWQQERQQVFSGVSLEAPGELVGEEDDEGSCSPPAVAYHSAVEYERRYILVVGGLLFNSSLRQVGIVVNGEEGRVRNMVSATPVTSDGDSEPLSLYQLDTVDSSWRRLRATVGTPSLTWSDIPRSGHIALRYHDDLYVIGSYKPQRELEIFQLSLLSFTWRRVETTVAPGHSLPCGRALPSGVVLPSTKGNQHPVILLYGGYSTVTRQYFDDAYTITL